MMAHQINFTQFTKTGTSSALAKAFRHNLISVRHLAEAVEQHSKVALQISEVLNEILGMTHHLLQPPPLLPSLAHPQSTAFQPADRTAGRSHRFAGTSDGDEQELSFQRRNGLCQYSHMSAHM